MTIVSAPSTCCGDVFPRWLRLEQAAGTCRRCDGIGLVRILGVPVFTGGSLDDDHHFSSPLPFIPL